MLQSTPAAWARSSCGTRRWVARGQLVAFGTATWFRESHRAAADARAAADKAAALSLADRGQAFLARQAALELEQLQASRRAAAEASQAETEARKVMDAAELAWQKWDGNPNTWDAFRKARAAHDAAWAKSNELAMRLPIMWVDDGDGGYRHLTEAQAAHQHWLDEFARTAAALDAAAIANPIPEVWADRLLANLRTELALANAMATALEVPDGTQV